MIEGNRLPVKMRPKKSQKESRVESKMKTRSGRIFKAKKALLKPSLCQLKGWIWATFQLS